MKSEGVKLEELAAGPQKMLRFKCPACSAEVRATERESYWGATCPQCGTKFIPVERRTGVKKQSEGVGMKVFALVMGAVLLLVLMGLVAGLAGVEGALAISGLVWIGVVIVVVVLLVGIFVRLGKR